MQVASRFPNYQLSPDIRLYERKQRPPEKRQFKKRLPDYERAAIAPTMVVTEREKQFLSALHYRYDGFMADYQILGQFFTNQRHFQRRFSLLFHNGYIAKTNREQRATLGCTACWLDEKGAALLADQAGIPLAKFKWVKPGERWSQRHHDLAANDFVQMLTKALHALPTVTLAACLGARHFQSQPDRIMFLDKAGKTQQRFIYPDKCVELSVQQPGTSTPKTLRFFLELDMKSEDNPRFAEEKIRPGIAYIKSEAYRQRFSDNGGRFLVVTTSERRMNNMLAEAEKTALPESSWFYYTTFAAISSDTLLTRPIWYRARNREPFALLSHF